MKRGAALALVAPLLVFLALTFVAPIGMFLWRAVADGEVRPILPRTVAALSGWDGKTLPRHAYPALVEDLREARQNDQTGLARAAARLNTDVPGLRGILPSTARQISRDPEMALTDAAPEWGDIETWGAIRRAAGPIGDFNLLAALDLKRDAAGDLGRAPPDQRGFLAILLRTLWISASATVLCLAVGYPLAWLMATAPPRWAPVLMAGVLLPFWTSLVVRSAAWMVLLQREGVINAALQRAGLIDAPLPLLFNRFAVLLAMVHILLPFAVLPIYATLRQMDWRLPRAAASLGARPMLGFWRVTLPLSLPGVGAGALLVFIQALGFYVTPALLGGANDQMLSWFVGFYATRSVNWGLAAALSVLLLAAVALVVALYARLVGFEKVRTA